MPAAYSLLILREHGTTPARRRALLDGTAMAAESLAEPGAEVKLGQVVRMIENANRVLPPGWDLVMGSALHASTHGPVGFATVSAPTLGKSLEVIARYGRVRAPFYRIRASSRAGEHRMAFDDRAGLPEAEWAVLVNLLMLSGQGLVESVLGRPIHEARFEMPYAAPAHAERFAEFFHGPVRFGCTEAAFVIPAPWLALECPLADPVMYAAAIRSLETGDRMLESKSFTLARAEQLIASRDDPPSLAEAARQLRVSTRTLGRRLRESGASYRGLVQSDQKRQAEALLADAEMQIAEVGYALGYEDPANFGRACRRWFGMSPSRYRSRLLRAARRRRSGER